MVNKAILIGNLGQEPEIKTVGETKVAQFSIATNEKWKDKEGNKKEKTTWHNIVAWRGLAEITEKFLTKGSKVYIEGKIDNRSYEKDGETKYISEVIVDKLQMLGGKTSEAPESAPPPAEDDLPF